MYMYSQVRTHINPTHFFFFFTLQVGEITKIMRAYINMMVKKRCSIMSVTSVASNWVR